MAEYPFSLEERSKPMNNIEYMMETINNLLDSKEKRHILGGILLSVSLLFGGLAITAITVKEEKNE